MKLGVTGSRNGMTAEQRESVHVLLRTAPLTVGRRELHHGDCVGADVETARMAKSLGYRVVAHPPVVPVLRAFHDSDEILPAFDYLTRDRHIVDACDVLLAVPDGPRRLRSGTWYTVDYALRIGRDLFVLAPDGTYMDDSEVAS